ncbi:MAG: DUF4160 domain-containing protein [Planctomycetota bacterium]
MPTISRFFGIAIRMYFDDHGLPHFHAYYAEHRAKLTIETLEVLDGELPRRAMAMVLEWAAEHRAELAENWRLAERHEGLRSIEPLR